MNASDFSDSACQLPGIEIEVADLKNAAMRSSNIMAALLVTGLLNVVPEGCHAADTFLAAAPKNVEQGSTVQQLAPWRNYAGQPFNKGLAAPSYVPFGHLSETERTGVALKSSGQTSDPQYAIDLPELGKPDGLMRPRTLQDVARRFHREGLPIARLWQTDSAALSLGLNNKGKPGLWFLKKLP